MARAGAMSIDTMRAWGWGLRTVAPHSIPSAWRSEAYSNRPVSLGTPSGRRVDSPIPPVTRVRRVVEVVTPAPLLALQPLPAGEPLERTDDGSVSCAAADVAGERLFDLGRGRMRVLLEQVDRRHHETGSAEPALHGARLVHRLLH